MANKQSGGWPSKNQGKLSGPGRDNKPPAAKPAPKPSPKPAPAPAHVKPKT